MVATQEDRDPWKPKSDFEIVDYLKPNLTGLLLFDASKVPHGAAVNDDTYFFTDQNRHYSRHLLNQAFLFFLDDGPTINRYWIRPIASLRWAQVHRPVIQYKL